MKTKISFTLVVILAVLAALWFLPGAGPRRPDRATLTQRQYELGKLANEYEMLRVTLDGAEQAGLGLLVGYTQQLASLAAKSQDTPEHRDLVQRLSQSIANEESKIDGIQKRRRTELIPLWQQIYKRQQEFDAL